jgi:phospholipase/carboxylesterase
MRRLSQIAFDAANRRVDSTRYASTLDDDARQRSGRNGPRVTDERTLEEVAYLEAVVRASALAAAVLADMERVAEALAPARSRDLAAAIASRFDADLSTIGDQLAAAPPPDDFQRFDAVFAAAFAHARDCVRLFISFPEAPAAERIPRILEALHHHAQAQEGFYVIRQLLPPLADYWTTPEARAAGLADPLPDPERPPLVRVSAGGHHGGFSVYVPEQYDPQRPWPVIVALHGGAGNGRDFLWTWVREARSRGYLLVAPSAAGSTWSETDDQGLLEILAWLGRRYHLATDRILLTGLSDGGTFTLVYGLAHPEVYRALAPCCGVFHPVSFGNGNLDRARRFPIYLVHGAQDFLFPIQYAHMTRDVLDQAGADVTFREIADLSHTYPRSENGPILSWFEGLGPRPPV